MAHCVSVYKRTRLHAARLIRSEDRDFIVGD